MTITKDKGKNTITITGVTLGKLLAIQRAFQLQAQSNVSLSPVAEDVLLEVNRAIKEAEK